MPKLLDYPCERLPKQLKIEFEHTADNEQYRYEVSAFNLKWFGFSIWGCIRINKFVWGRLPPSWRTWGRRGSLGWKRLWTIESTRTFIIEANGKIPKDYGVRKELPGNGMNKGILPTELLLDKSLHEIEQKLCETQSRMRRLYLEKGLSLSRHVG